MTQTTAHYEGTGNTHFVTHCDCFVCFLAIPVQHKAHKTPMYTKIPDFGILKGYTPALPRQLHEIKSYGLLYEWNSLIGVTFLQTYNFLTAVTSTQQSATEGTDYVALSGTAVFDANMDDDEATVMLTISPDIFVEGTEQLQLSLSVPSSAGAAGEVDKAVVNILDDDTPSKTAKYTIKVVGCRHFSFSVFPRCELIYQRCLTLLFIYRKQIVSDLFLKVFEETNKKYVKKES